LRAPLHSVVRATDRDTGQLAGSAEFEADADVASGDCQRSGTDRKVKPASGT